MLGRSWCNSINYGNKVIIITIAGICVHSWQGVENGE